MTPEARNLQPGTAKWNNVLFIVFLIWATVGLFITGLQIRPATIVSWDLPAFFEQFGIACLYYGDLIFMLLASGVVAQSLLPRLTPRHVLMAFLLITIVSGAVETFGTLTGIPFGQYLYTQNMGPRWFGILPAAIPLAWWVVVGGFTITLKQAAEPFPALQRYTRSAGAFAILVGLAATTFDWVMEPYAWHVMEYWVWVDPHSPSGTAPADGIPWQNYASWFVLAYFLTRTSMLTQLPPHPMDWRPTLVIAIMLIQFCLGRLVSL